MYREARTLLTPDAFAQLYSGRQTIPSRDDAGVDHNRGLWQERMATPPVKSSVQPDPVVNAWSVTALHPHRLT